MQKAASTASIPHFVRRVESGTTYRARCRIDQMQSVIAGMVGKRLMYRDLVG